jgi:hypothetical protein
MIAATMGAVWTALATTVAQAPTCDDLLGRAQTLAGRLHTAEAVDELVAQAAGRCEVRTTSTYLRGLLAAQAAAAKGGDDVSLAPVRAAVAALEMVGEAGGPAAIAGLVLRAAAAAAQSEREEMAVWLAQALQLERARGAQGASGAPVLSAHQMAGELWLQVHRYDEAAAAFLVARGVGVDSPRLALGLARARARDLRTAEACEAYRDVERLASDGRAAMDVEVAEAREFLGQPACGSTFRR